MQITRQTDYAVRCVLYLSKEYDRMASVSEISKHMHIPKSFLAKILQGLVKAGIVESSRGIKGGFQLAKGPKEISLLDVIEAIEGPVAMNRCAIDKRLCNLSNTCSVHPVWIEIRKEVEKRLRHYSFEKLKALKR